MITSEFLEISSSIVPDRSAVIFEGKRYTFKQLNERVNRLASALARLEIKKGDRVAFLQVNCNQCVETYFATAKLGAIYLPLNYRSKEDELTYILNFSEANTLFIGSRYLDLIDSIRGRLPALKYYISIETPYKDMLYYEDITKSSPLDVISVDTAEEETTILLYTAGTTGKPKGVMLPHRSFSVYVLDNVSPPDPGVEEKNILTVPLYHIAGIQAMMSAIYGARTLVMQRQFEAQAWMELVEKEKVNRAMMVPTMLKQLVDHPDFGKYDLSSLKVITYGAAPMPLSILEKALDFFPGVSFINAFGQTETASTITMLSPEDHVITGVGEEREKKLKRLTSIGKPLADVEMKIVDETGKEMPPGQIGEIITRGPRIMSGYIRPKRRLPEPSIKKVGFIPVTWDTGMKTVIIIYPVETQILSNGQVNISHPKNWRTLSVPIPKLKM